MADPLYIAQLVIFIIFLQPALYVLWKHGKHGLEGWLFLQLLCCVRIAGAAVIIHQGTNTGLAGTILSSIGLAPLLLSSAGILHEARAYRNPHTNRKLEFLVGMQYHMLVVVSLVLVIVGIVQFEEKKTTKTTKDLLKAGIALVMLNWVLLNLGALVSWRSRKVIRTSPGYNDGTKLLVAVAMAIPFILIRVIYAAISLILEVDGSSSGFPRSRTAKIVMSIVPEMIVVAILLAAGIATRDIKHSYTRGHGNEQRQVEQAYTLNQK